MREFYHLMAIAIAAVAFAACQKEPAFLADVTYPEEANGNAIVVDVWSNNFTLDIKSDGEWRVESSDFITVKPSEGTGNATVKVYVEDNEEEQRLKGNVTIVFPGHEEQNKTLAVEQKWTGEYDENADQMKRTNKVYVIGYGYDTTKGLYANFDCVKAQIFKSGELIAEGLQGYGQPNMDAVLSTVTGSSISDISNKLTVKANANGGVGKFKAEANASFTMNYTDNSTHEYAINYLEATLTTTSFEIPIGDLITDWMTANAYKNINGLSSYYSGQKGIERLIRDYGTHVVISARLGGRIRQSIDVDISKISTSYDLNVFAKASYEGVMAKAGGSVNDDFHDSFKNNSEAMTIKVQALGGNSDLAAALMAKEGFTKDNYEAWFKSVKEDNMTLMGFVDDESLLPLYELVDADKYPERYQDIYNYMNGAEMAAKYEDNSTYDTGTVTAFEVPTFDNAYNSTLVKDIKLGGQLVGQVCNEYIPAIDRDKRVTVVYPVIGTTVRYNMGFFIGDDTHKPARVAWNGTNTNISEYPDLDFGKATKLYLRGASIAAAPDPSLVVMDGTLADEYLDGVRYNREKGANESSVYPIVKIFNKVWTREEYSVSITGNHGRNVTVTMDGKSVVVDREYYRKSNIKNKNDFPRGWRIASLSDFTEMIDKLSANGHSLPGLALNNGGVTGFNTYNVGYFSNNNWYQQSYAIWGTSDNNYIWIYDNGQVGDHGKQYEFWDDELYLCIRLVKE